MNETAATRTIDAQELGPPAKFDAEPVRRKSPRWIFIAAALFVAILAATGLAAWHARGYFKGVAADREAKQKQAEEAAAQERRKKKFELAVPQAALPDAFERPKDDPVEAIPLASPAPVPMAPPAAPEPQPARASMFHTVQAEQGAAPATSPAAAAVSPAPATARGGGPARARTVQEEARRNAPAALTSTRQALASHLGNRSYLLARGSSMPCALLTQLDSTVRGPVSCIVTHDIYSDDGRVLLVERGSMASGEYGATALKAGDRRLAIVWQRIKTPNGIVIDVDSPAADPVGTVGTDGHVNNHWWERIGAALMLSLIDDAIQLQAAKEGAQASEGTSTQPYQATAGTTKSIAERVLEATINIPPTITKNRGERLLVMVNRDLWFDQVYEVTPR